MGPFQDWLEGLKIDTTYEVLREEMDRAKFPPLDPIEITAYGDVEREWLMPVNSMRENMGSLSNALTNSTNVNGSYWYNPPNSYTVFGAPLPTLSVPVTFIPSEPITPAEDDDIAWLRRRVKEICWDPRRK